MTQIAPYKRLTYSAYLNATIEDRYVLPVQSEGKAINKRFVERFESALALRGESVNAALITLRARGFILHRSTLNRWKSGIIPYFNSFQFLFLADYVGKTFEEMVQP